MENPLYIFNMNLVFLNYTFFCCKKMLALEFSKTQRRYKTPHFYRTGGGEVYMEKTIMCQISSLPLPHIMHIILCGDNDYNSK